MDHPEIEQLLSLREDAPADPRLRAHVAGCARCAARLERLAELERVLALGPPPRLDEALVERVAALAAARARRPRRPRLVAAPERPAEALALRGLARERLLYVAGDYTIDLALLGGGTLVGHLLAPDEADPFLRGGRSVLAGDEGLREAAIEANGDFRFADVAPGEHALLLEADGREIVVPRLDLSGGAAGRG